MEKKISTLFRLRKDQILNDKLFPIYLRVTIDGQRFEWSTQRYVEESKWSVTAGRVKGNTEESKTFNAYLDLVKHKVFVYQKELILEQKELTITSFKAKWLGKSGTNRMILDVFRHNNEKQEKLVGKDFAQGTLGIFKTTYDHTRKFIEWKYNTDDLEITKLDYEFISEYEFWLKTMRNCAQNTTMKYLANFKKIVLICVKNGWLQKDPFFNYKFKRVEVVREYLTDFELKSMQEKQFPTERLERVRDIFLFCCYTGLAYADVKKLKRSEIKVGIDGKKWIFTFRQKTDTSSRIPILPVSLALMEKYTNHPECINKDNLLPVLSNQKMNSYLKEIADVCGINKELTFHIARHTFATTITLNNGVPIETVSKMLGHTNLRMTQHYAKLLDTRISEDMKALSQKLSGISI